MNSGFGNQNVNQSSGKSSDFFSKYDKISMFRTTIIKEWQGVAYMMIDMGFPITDAMQDAMDECRFQQVLNLLSKNQDNEALSKTNDQGMNLFHIYAKQVDHNLTEIFVKIFVELKER